MSAGSEMRPAALPAAPQGQQIVRIVLGGWLVTGVLATLFLLARRLSGDLQQPLPPGTLALLAFGCVCFVVTIRTIWPRIVGDVPGQHQAARWAPRALLILLAVAILPGAHGAVIASFLVLALALETAPALLRRFGMMSPRMRNRDLPVQCDPPGDEPRTRFDPEPERPFVAPSSTDHRDTITQHLVRRRDEQGRDVLDGFLRARYEPGQRTAVLHVAFCPPFASVPNFRATAREGFPAQVKATQLQPYGVRLEVRLKSAAKEPQPVEVDISAVEPVDASKLRTET